LGKVYANELNINTEVVQSSDDSDS